eukprot:77333_1
MKQRRIASESIMTPMNLDVIDKRVFTRKEGRVTMTNVYVMAMILTWSNVLFLLLLLIVGLFVYVCMDRTFNSTFAKGLHFVRAMSSGYTLGKRNTLPSKIHVSETFVSVLAKFTELFYSIPFQFIDDQIRKGVMHKLLPLVAEASNLHNDLFDLACMISVRLRSIALFASIVPYEYHYNSYRTFPYAITVHDLCSNASILNGDYIDESMVMPTAYNKSFPLQNTSNIYLNNIVYTDERYWYLYQIKTITKSIGKIKFKYYAQENKMIHNVWSMPNEMVTQSLNCTPCFKNISRRSLQLKICTLQFYHPMLNELIEVPLCNQSMRNTDWRINFNESQQLWALYQNDTIKQYFDYIQPISYSHNRMSQIHTHSIRVHVEDAPLFNGIYHALAPDKYWSRLGLFDSPESIQTASHFYKENIHNNGRTLYHLFHEKHGNIHQWTLQSHEVVMVSRSVQSFNQSVTLDVIQWHTTNHSCNRFKVEIKRDKLFEAPYIHKVILHYSKSQKPAQQQWTSVLMEPHLAFKFDILYLKQNTPSDTNSEIISSIHSIKVSVEDCIQTTSHFAYLKLEKLDMRAEVFRGHVYGYADVFFRDIETCMQWVRLFSANQQQENADTQKIKEKIKWMFQNDPIHSKYKKMQLLSYFI